jgi:hypothetical protein
MLPSKFLVLSSEYPKSARPVTSFDLLVVAAISHPHHGDLKYQGPAIVSHYH